MPKLTYAQILQKIEALSPRHAEIEALLREIYLPTGPNAQTDAQVNSVGMVTEPKITDNLDGSVTIGEADCQLYSNATFIPPADYYVIAEKTITLTDNDVNYVIVDYNGGNPVYDVTLDVTDIEVSSVIPVNTFYRDDSEVHSLSWDTPGLGLSEKLFFKDVKLTRFRQESGVIIGEAGTRNITATVGVVWSGVKRHNMGAFTSLTDEYHQRYHVSGEWVFVTDTQYNNTYYDDGTDLVEATNNKYIVNWIYRDVGSLFTHGDEVFGTAQYNTVEAARSAQPPANLPGVMASHHILIGRIIVQKGANVASAIETAFGEFFTPTTDITPIPTPVCLSEFVSIPARDAEENVHGALASIVTGHDLSAGDLTLTGATAQGIGKLVIVVNAGSDFDGTITATGTEVNRDTGAETADQVSTMTVDVLTTDNSAADANSVVKHDLTNAYITDRWFTGDVVISSSDTTITDIDVYHCAFDQFNDAAVINLNTFDMNFLCTLSTGAALSARLYTVEVTGDKVDIAAVAEYVESTFVTGRYYRIRRSDLGVTLDGTTDGIFLTTAYLGSPSKFADAGTKVWAAVVPS